MTMARKILIGLMLLFVAYGAAEVALRLSVKPPPKPSDFFYASQPLSRIRFTIQHEVPGLSER